MFTTDPARSETPATAAPTDWRHVPLPEIIGYVGAALMVSAGLNLVSQTWDTWPKPVQFGVVIAGAVALYTTSLILTMTAGGLGPLRAHVIRRRLFSVLLVVAVPLLAAAFAVALDWAGVVVDAEGSYWPIGIASVALVAAGIAAWWAPGVVPTLGVAFASFLWLQVVIGQILRPWEQPIAVAAVSAVATTAWLIVAPRFLPPRSLTEALGVAGFIVLQMAHAFMAFDFPPLLDEVGQQRLT